MFFNVHACFVFSTFTQIEKTRSLFERMNSMNKGVKPSRWQCTTSSHPATTIQDSNRSRHFPILASNIHPRHTRRSNIHVASRKGIKFFSYFWSIVLSLLGLFRNLSFKKQIKTFCISFFLKGSSYRRYNYFFTTVKLPLSCQIILLMFPGKWGKLNGCSLNESVSKLMCSSADQLFTLSDSIENDWGQLGKLPLWRFETRLRSP